MRPEGLRAQRRIKESLRYVQAATWQHATLELGLFALLAHLPTCQYLQSHTSEQACLAADHGFSSCLRLFHVGPRFHYKSICLSVLSLPASGLDSLLRATLRAEMLLLMYAPAPQPLNQLVAGGNSKHLPPLVKQN